MKKRWGCLFTLLIIVGGLFWGLQSDKPIQSHEQLAQVAPSVAPLTMAAQQVLHQAALGASDASVAVRWDEQEALTVLRHLLGNHDTLLQGRYQLQDDYVLATVPVTFWGVSTQVSMRLNPKIEGGHIGVASSKSICWTHTDDIASCLRRGTISLARDASCGWQFD